MPIEVEVRHDAAGVVYHCRGRITIDDFLLANQSFLLTPDEIRKWRYSLIDLTTVESIDINHDDVSRVVTQNATIASNAVHGVLLAVASPQDLGYGLARMWGTLVGRFGWETMTFRTLTEAEDWVVRRVKEKFGMELARPA
jgi:hypothetical protein